MGIYWKARYGKCIYQAPDGARVYQNKIYRWLTLDSPALQTLLNRFQPERFSLPYLKPFTLGVRTIPGSCCLLGLGGGAVAHVTYPYLKHLPFTAVESNPHVINIAERYFMLDKIKNLEIIHQDANIFINTTNTQYQHLLIDLYLANNFPEQCQQLDFFELCQQHMLPNGILSINLASHQDAWITLQILREIFKQNTICIPIKRTANIIILATPSLSTYPWLTRLARCWDSEWGYVAWTT